MKLLTAEIRKRLPILYATEKTPADLKVVHLKLFMPSSGSCTWYAVEGSPEGDDFIFFGFAVGPEPEWGYFSLNELQSVKGPFGLGIERDLWFKPRPFGEVRQTEPYLRSLNL